LLEIEPELTISGFFARIPVPLDRMAKPTRTRCERPDCRSDRRRSRSTLAAAGCVKVFEDRASGVRANRVGLRAALDHERDGDVLIVWKLGRPGRSLPHLIETVTSLATRGVGFHSTTEAIDTTTPGERLVFHLFGPLGQFERDLIQERARALPHPRRAAERADASPWSPARSLHVLVPSSPKG
jgi:DNA invertase Pin-like site-specific DNA recombinase